MSEWGFGRVELGFLGEILGVEMIGSDKVVVFVDGYVFDG